MASDDRPPIRRLPFQAGMAVARVEGDARRRDHRRPVRDGVGEFGMGRRRRGCRAVIMLAPAHHRPTVVAPRLRDVELVAAHRAELGLPQLAARWVDGGALRVAMAVGPDLRPRILLTDEGVVVGDRSVRIDAHDLAEIVGEILRRAELEALAEGDEQLAVRREGEPRAEMVAALDLRLLPEDHFDIVETAIGELAARDRRPGAALAGLGSRRDRQGGSVRSRDRARRRAARLALRRRPPARR